MYLLEAKLRRERLTPILKVSRLARPSFVRGATVTRTLELGRGRPNGGPSTDRNRLCAKIAQGDILPMKPERQWEVALLVGAPGRSG